MGPSLIFMQPRLEIYMRLSSAEMMAIKIIINITAVGTDSSPCQINLLIGSKMGTGQ